MRRNLLLVALAALAFGACSDNESTAPSTSEAPVRTRSSYSEPGLPGHMLKPTNVPTAIVGSVESLSEARWDTADGRSPAASGREDPAAIRYRTATIDVERVLWEHDADDMPEDRKDAVREASPTMTIVIHLPGRGEGGRGDPPPFALGPPAEVGDRVIWLLYPWSVRDRGPVASIASAMSWIVDGGGRATSSYWTDEPPVDAEALIANLLDAHANPHNWMTGDMRNLMHPDREPEPTTSTTTTTAPESTSTTGDPATLDTEDCC